MYYPNSEEIEDAVLIHKDPVVAIAALRRSKMLDAVKEVINNSESAYEVTLATVVRELVLSAKL